MRRRKGAGKYRWTPGKLLIYLLLLGFALLFAAPVLFMILTSFKIESQVWAYPIVWIPDPFTLDNYREASYYIPYAGALFNSFFIAFAAVLSQALVGSMAAYAFAFIDFRGKNALFLLILATMMIPSYVLIIPLYLIMDKLKLLNTYFALIAPAMISAFSIYLLRSFFQAIPRELDESAKIDGCNRLQTLVRIMLPLSAPALVSMGIFVFMNQWNNFLWPLIATSSNDVRPLTVFLSYFTVGKKTAYGPLMAGATMASLPLLVIFLFAQRWFIEGLAMTGIKG